MNDATSTPDEPDRTDQDGRGAVVTGEQAVVTPAAESPAAEVAGAEPDGAGVNGAEAHAAEAHGAEANGAGTNGAGSASSPTPRPSPHPGPVGATVPVVEDPPEVPAAPVSGTNGSSPSLRKSAAIAAEAPTTQMQLPLLPNGSRPAPPDSDITRPVGRGEFPTPGPVPGPAAAAPPPWQRVPGRDAPTPMPVSHGPAGGLLDDEGPTTFLEAPPRPDDPAAQGDRSAETSGSSWGGIRARNRPPRQAALQLKRLDPWSVLKLAIVLALVLFLVWMVAIGVLYGVLDGMGVWDRLNGTYADLVSGEAPTGSPLISAGRVLGLAAVVGAINSLLFAVAMTVGAFVYNVSADLVGGIEVTLSERD